MKKIIYIFILFLSFPSFAGAGAFNTLPPNALSAGMGGSRVAGRGEVSCLDYNPAGLSCIDNLNLSFSYRDYYSLGLVGHSYAGLAYPVGQGVGFAFSLDRVGTTRNIEFLDYSEEKYSLGVGADVNSIPGLSAGGAFTFYRVVSEENASGWGLSGGLLWTPQNLKELSLGLSLRNLNNPAITWTTGAEDRLSPSFATGLEYRHFSGLSGALSLGDGLKTGVQYDFPGNIFSLRAGYRGLADFRGTLSAGLSVAYSFFRIDYAAESHAALGLSHFFTVNTYIDRIRM